MIATQVIAPGKAVFVEAPEPQLQPGHALVRPVLVSLCGSDIYMLRYAPKENYPYPVGTTGHEMIGVVEAVAAPDSGIKPGDLALTIAPAHTAMTELFLAPIEHVLVLPPGKPLEHLLMGQQLGTVIYSCKVLPSVIGKDVAVIGQGSAGLFFDYCLRRMGARQVIGLDLAPARVAAGFKFGATRSVNNGQVNALEAVKELTQGRLADLVIEAAGEVEAIRLAPQLVKVGGHIHFFGIPRGQVFPFDYAGFFFKFCSTTSRSDTWREPGELSFRQALEWIARGEVDVAPMLTHRLPFERVMEGYDMATTRADGLIKVVIEMPAYRRFCHT